MGENIPVYNQRIVLEHSAYAEQVPTQPHLAVGATRTISLPPPMREYLPKVHFGQLQPSAVRDPAGVAVVAIYV